MVTRSDNTSKTATIAVVVVICAVLLVSFLSLTGLSDKSTHDGFSEPLSSIPNTTTHRSEAIDEIDIDTVTPVTERNFADREFIREVFPVFAQWEPGLIKSYFAASTQLATTDTELGTVMEILSARLGQLQYFGEPQPAFNPDASIDAMNQPISAYELNAYEFLATFQNGVAKVNLVITHEGNQPLLYSIDVQVVDNKPLVTFTGQNT